MFSSDSPFDCIWNIYCHCFWVYSCISTDTCTGDILGELFVEVVQTVKREQGLLVVGKLLGYKVQTALPTERKFIQTIDAFCWTPKSFAQRITFLSNIKHGEFSENILYPLTMHRVSDKVRLDSNSPRVVVSSDNFYTVIAPNAQEHEILYWLIKRSQETKQTKWSTIQ